MPKSAVQPRNTVQRVALVLVVVSTVFAIIASGLKAADDNTYESLHMFALMVMLVCYMVFIGSVMLGKRRAVPKLALYRDIADSGSEGVGDRKADRLEECMVDCTPEQVVRISPLSSEDAFVAASRSESPMREGRVPLVSPPTPLELRTVPTWRKQSIRAIVVRNVVVDLPLLRLVSQFPNVSLLDIQGCRVESEAWHELVHFDQLQYVWAHGAATPAELRELHFTLPEIEISLEPVALRPACVTGLPLWRVSGG